MFNLIKKLFGMGPSVDYQALMQKGAIILDVRTKNEFQSGHIKGSVNIPVQSLGSNLSKLKKDRPIITCCASGMRSASAKSILQSNGFNEVYNGGSWASLQNKL
jgi:rhodanese-related sulfurtransferase